MKKADRIDWLTWVRPGGDRVRFSHAFRVVGGVRVERSLCWNRPGKGAVVEAGTPAENRCPSCDDEMRRRAKQQPARGDVYEPTHTFEDWDR